MAENKMKQVAQMFGKKLNERFTIVRGDKNIGAVFTAAGLEVWDYYNPYIDLDSFVLMDLLTGQAEIMRD